MELLTRKEAAEYLRLSLRKLDALAAADQIRRVKLGEGKRGRVLFRRTDLDAYVQDNLSVDGRELERRVAEITGA